MPIVQEVKVRMLTVAVRDDDRLMLGEPEPFEHVVGNPLHSGSIHGVTGIEA